MPQDHFSPAAGTPLAPSSRSPHDPDATASHPHYDFDDPVLELLEDDIVRELTEALRRRGLGKYAEMLSDTLAALTLVALLPSEHRGGALAVLETLPRQQLEAYGLMEPHDPTRASWALTAEGETVAAVLAEAAPPLTHDERERAHDEVDELLAATEAEFDDVGD